MGKQFEPKHVRNAEIVRRVDAGERQSALAKEYGISRSLVSAICLRAKAKAEWAQGPFGPLPTRCYSILERVMKKHMGLSSFTIADLKTFIEQNADWEKKIRMAPNCGPARFAEINEFFLENGLVPAGK